MISCTITTFKFLFYFYCIPLILQVTTGNRPRTSTEVMSDQTNSSAPAKGGDEAVFTAADYLAFNMAKEKSATIDHNRGTVEREKLADAPAIAVSHSEILAIQAGKGTRRAGAGTSENFPVETVEQPEDEKDERYNNKVRMKEAEVETPQEANQANTNATAQDRGPSFKAKMSSIGGEEKAVGAAEAAPASAAMGGRGPRFVPGMTLDEKLIKAMALKVKRIWCCTFPTSCQGGL